MKSAKNVSTGALGRTGVTFYVFLPPIQHSRVWFLRCHNQYSTYITPMPLSALTANASSLYDPVKFTV